MGSEVEIMAPMPERGPNAKITLEEGNKSGKEDYSIWRKMMGLKMEDI